MNRTPLKSSLLALIKQPVLIIQGDQSETCPMKYAEKMAAELVNAEKGAIIYTVKGGGGFLPVVPANASIVNSVIAKFLARLPKKESKLVPPEPPREERMQQALNKLSEIIGNPKIATRDPLCSLSFSCLTPEIAKTQADALALFGKDQATAYSPLRANGRPIRKFSERKAEHWFHGERDGSSYTHAAAPAAPPSTLTGLKGSRPEKLLRKDSELHEADLSDVLPLVPTSEPIISAVDSRVRRVTSIVPGSVDKHISKGLVAKATAHSAGATHLHRLML